MKKFAYGVVLTLGLIVVVFFAGPRPAVDTAVRAPLLPDSLTAYLAQSEGRFPDLTIGAEKRIIWADTATKRRTPVSVVYLHGFSATRQEVAPLCDTLAARLGANLFYTRLAGHGLPGDALGTASVNDWLNDTVEALTLGRRLGEKVILVGTSTGGTLATWLAAQPAYANDLLALVLLSPNFGLPDPNAAMLLWPWGAQIGRAVLGTHHEWQPANEAQARYWTVRYPVDAIVKMMGLVDLVGQLDLGAVKVPVYVVYSPEDEVVSVPAIEDAYERFGAAYKRRAAVQPFNEQASHVLVGDILAPAATVPLADSILAFIHPLLQR